MNDIEIKHELKNVLSPHEEILWTGRPPQRILFRRTDFFLIPFSIFWFGFAIFWETTVAMTNAPFFFKLWGIPFLVAGLYLTVGRFFLDARKRKNTFYVITQDSIFIRSGIFSPDIVTISINTLSLMTCTFKPDGSGTIVLGPENFRNTGMQGIDWPGVKQTPRLEMIPNVKKVYDIIIQNQYKR